MRLHGAGRVTVRPAIIDAVRALNACLIAADYRTRAADTGAYACRQKVGGGGWSNHSYGIALDINWRSNPYGPRLVTDMPRSMVEAIKAIKTNSGARVWGWGGDWRGNKDAMHFEVICSPRDVASGIAGKPLPPQPKPPTIVTPPPVPEVPVDETEWRFGMAQIIRCPDNSAVVNPNTWFAMNENMEVRPIPNYDMVQFMLDCGMIPHARLSPAGHVVPIDCPWGLFRLMRRM